MYGAATPGSHCSYVFVPTVDSTCKGITSKARYQKDSAMIKVSIGTPSDRAAAARLSNISTFKGE